MASDGEITPALLTPSLSKITTFFLFWIDVAISIPRLNPSPIAVSPFVGEILESSSITLSLVGLKYAAVVAPVPNITIPALSLGGNDSTRILQNLLQLQVC